CNRWILFPALVLFMFANPARAHRLDEYLQAALIEIGPAQITLKLNLAPSVEIAEAVLQSIDRDRDDHISEEEGAAYFASLVKELVMRIDDRPLQLELLRTEMDSISELKEGTG